MDIRAHSYAPSGDLELARRGCEQAAERGGPQALHAHRHGEACGEACSIIEAGQPERPLLPRRLRPAPARPAELEISLADLERLDPAGISPDPPSRVCAA